MRHLGGVVVDAELVHAADRQRRVDQVGEAGDRVPRRIAAIGEAGDADPPARRLAGGDQRLDPGADVLLLAPAPAVLLDRLAEGMAEAGRAAVVGIQHGEAGAGQELHDRVGPVLAVPGRSAVHPADEAAARPRRLVEPALDLAAVDRAPAEIPRRGEILRRRGDQPAGLGEVAQRPLGRIDPDQVMGAPRAVGLGDPVAARQLADRQQAALARGEGLFRAAGEIDQLGGDPALDEFQHHRPAPVAARHDEIDVARRVVDQPAQRAGGEVVDADAFMGRRLRLHQQFAPGAGPMRLHLVAGAEIQDLSVVLAVDPHRPDLGAGRMQVAARIDHHLPVRRDLRREAGDAVRLGEDLARAGRQVLAIDPAARGRRAGRIVDIRREDDAAAVAGEIAAEHVVVVLQRRQRRRRGTGGDIQAEQPVVLVGADRLRQDQAAAVGGDGIDVEVILARGQPPRRLRAVGRRQPDVPGIVEPGPAPGHPSAVAGDAHRPEHRIARPDPCQVGDAAIGLHRKASAKNCARRR